MIRRFSRGPFAALIVDCILLAQYGRLLESFCNVCVEYESDYPRQR